MTEIFEAPAFVAPVDPAETIRFGQGFRDAVIQGYESSPLAAGLRLAETSMRAEFTGGVTGVGATLRSEYEQQSQLAEASKSFMWAQRDEAEAYLAERGLTPEDVKLSSYGANRLVLETVAEYRIAEKKRQTAIAQIGGAGSFTGSLIGSAVDPVGLLLNFVPVVGQARYARMLGSAGSALGRVGVRTAVGAAEGAVGSAIGETLVIAERNYTGGIYTTHDFMANIAFGTIVGAGMHGGIGAFREVTGTGLLEVERYAKGKAAQSVSELPEPIKYDALYTALGNATEGISVDVRPITDAHLSFDAGRSLDIVRSIDNDIRSLSGDPGARPDGASIADVLARYNQDDLPPRLVRSLRGAANNEQAASIISEYVRREGIVNRTRIHDLAEYYGAPPSLAQFLAREGGLNEAVATKLGRDVDARGTFTDTGVDVKGNKRLYRKNAGMSLDEAKLAAVRAGYFDVEGRRVSDRKFREALREDLSGNGYYRPADSAKMEKFDAFVRDVEKSLAASDVPAYVTPDAIRENMQTLSAPERSIFYDAETKELVDNAAMNVRDLAIPDGQQTIADAELDAVMATLDTLDKAEADAVRARMAEADKALSQETNAIRVAAECLLGGAQ